jgi:hypothetical protein
MDMIRMISRIVGVHEDIIQIYHDINIQEIRKEGVKEALESSWCVGKTFWNDPEIVGAITGPESGFVLVTSSDGASDRRGIGPVWCRYTEKVH